MDAHGRTFLFMSYARQDEALCDDFRRNLLHEGFSTWHDGVIRPDEDYRQKIFQALEEADAVIVVWSDFAVKSLWVIDEATRAAKQRKLICTHVPGFQPTKIPIELGYRHSVDIRHISDIRTALGTLGLMPKVTPKRDSATGPLIHYLGSLVRIRSRVPAGDLRLHELDQVIEIVARRQIVGLDYLQASVAIALLVNDLRDLPSEDKLALEALSTEVSHLKAANFANLAPEGT
jgi:hypothetical protein